MSKIGKLPIQIADKVAVKLQGKTVFVEGPNGKLSYTVAEGITVEQKDKELIITRANDSAELRALHGTSRARIANMLIGVATGFTKKLEIQGVGFKASVAGNVVTMNLGYSHPCVYNLPAGVKVTVEDATKLTVTGSDKNDVGRVSAELRAFYPPEPYKGKGVRYVGEHVVRKEGKTVQ